MGQSGSLLSPGHHTPPSPLSNDGHIASETGPTPRQPTRAGDFLTPDIQPTNDGLCKPEPGTGSKPHKLCADAVDDVGPDNNEYYTDEDIFAEDPNHYKPGGFHPVSLGDRFGPAGRYRVFNKLGFGGFGTVWLCRDTLEGKWRALKIERAYDRKKPVRDVYRELMIKQHIDLTFDGDLADHHIGIPSEYFWISGPNGCHLCAVMPVLGPTLSSVQGYYGLHSTILKDICFQLAQSLKFLHSHGICHGDFRPDNILFQLADDIDEWSEEDMNRAIGPPVVFEVLADSTGRRGPGIPPYLVPPRGFKFSSGLCSTKITLIDFGVGYHAESPPTNSGIPCPFAAPEEMLGQYPIGFSSDIWSLACTMSVVLRNYSPFDEWPNYTESVIGEVEKIIGPLPHPYRSAWNRDFKFRFQHDEHDETLPVAIDPRSWARLQEREGKRTTHDGTLVKDRLLFPFVNGGDRLYIDAAQAEEIAQALAVDATRLPGFTDVDDGHVEMDFKKRVPAPVDIGDATMFCDLLRSIFKWDPRQRATIDMVMRHPWFEGRDGGNRFRCVVM